MQADPIGPLFDSLARRLRDEASETFRLQGAAALIYGAGKIGKAVCRVLAERGVPVRGFLDRAATPGAHWQGVPIFAPDDPALTPAERRDSLVVVGIFSHEVEVLPIVSLLQELGYGTITPFLNFHGFFPQELGDRYWLTDRKFYLGAETQARAAYALWSDEGSRRLYEATLRFRFFQDYAAMPPHDPRPEYFPPDLPAWPMPLRYVDCGAFDGDTLRELTSLRLPVQAVAAFEPDPVNFGKLARYVSKEPALAAAETVCLFPCCLGAATGPLRFSSGEGVASHVTQAGDTFAQGVALDDALPGFRPNLIKMDIEGAEYDALRGARRLIAEHRPGLAVCLYHRAAHLWQIPLLVRELTGGGGQFFLRYYAENGYDVILYWLPG